MLKVGLTGGIASGKTAVRGMFAELGAHVMDADDIARRLMEPGKPVYEEVVKHFGIEILNSDKSINRGRLAEMAFGSGASSRHIEELNRIVHPAVIQTQNEWMTEIGRRDPQAIAIVEAALLLEAGARKDFDRLIVITCRPEQRIERWARRTGTDMAAADREVSRRIAAQFPDKEKIKATDYVIDNSGTLDETSRQVKEIFAKLKALRF